MGDPGWGEGGGKSWMWGEREREKLVSGPGEHALVVEKVFVGCALMCILTFFFFFSFGKLLRAAGK